MPNQAHFRNSVVTWDEATSTIDGKRIDGIVWAFDFSNH